MQTVLKRPIIPLTRFVLSVLLPFGVALFLFYILMRPSFNDFRFMTGLMGLTTLGSVVFSYVAYRMEWIQRVPRLSYAMMVVYFLAGVLVFVNVWVIANLMFLNHHDFLLATVLLIFATGIASMAGFFLSTALTDRLSALSNAAGRISQGQFDVRVQVSGRDEVAQLAAAFNSMAAQLEAANHKQREVEALRRDLIAWVGHDLRTPLSSIRAVLEALADGVVDDPETVKRYLHTAQQDIRSLSHLIDELFEMSQLDAGGLKLEVHLYSLSDLISDTIESFTQLANQKQVSLAGAVEPGLDPVRMDAPRIGRVLGNLVSNALRHTPAQGAVSLRAWREDNWINIQVRDSGEGIKTEDLAHVFDRFYRGEKSRSRRTGGAGLGLAIAKGIVDAHGGTIHVESAPNQGAVFTVRLPG